MSSLKQTFEVLLSDDVRPFLRERGFAKSHATFRRKRAPLYDMIQFQSSQWNGVTPWHAFFVNVGVGSTEIDAAWPPPGADRGRAPTYFLWTRWERLVPGLASELRLDETTDPNELAGQLCDGLDRVLTVIENVDTSWALVERAIARNDSALVEKTCAYLVATGNIESLTQYITALRGEFGNERPWIFINRRITEATGAWASTLVEQGLLDPVPDHVGGGD